VVPEAKQVGFSTPGRLFSQNSVIPAQYPGNLFGPVAG